MRDEDAVRRTCEVEVEVRCLERPVHSGQKGGPMPDTVQVLCRILADLPAEDGATLRVIGFESQPVRGAANKIVDVARARIRMETVDGQAARAARRLIRTITRDPPLRAQVHARILS